jgi:Malectin domain
MESMKSVVLIVLMATKVIAFDQIYAINAGGDAITDSDGIRYQKGDSGLINQDWGDKLDLTNIANQDQEIYKKAICTQQQTMVEYNLPLKSDGFYVLIAKFSYAWLQSRSYQSMTLNNEISLIYPFDVYTLCGGYFGNICDVYMYFCVSDNKLYYKDLSMPIIKNEALHFTLYSVQSKIITIAALVLLKGSLGERHTLKNSATNETLYFDPAKMNPTCSSAIQQKSTPTKNPKTNSKKGTTSPNTVTQSSFKQSMDDFNASTLKNFTALVNHQEAEIQSEIKASTERLTYILKQSNGHMNKDIYEKIEVLQIEQASFKVEMQEIKKKINDIRQSLETILTSLMISHDTNSN